MRRETDSGFTLVELLVAMVVALLVLGATVSLTGQMQNAYRRQLEAATAQQEARNALEWIGRLIKTAGSNPYNLIVTPCPTAGTAVLGVWIDPNGDTVHDDLRLQTDLSPTNGLVGGAAGTCTEPNEDVTIAHDAVNSTITLTDNNLGGGAVARTDNIVSDLQFVYRDANRNVTALSTSVVFVDTSITVRSRVNDPTTNAPEVYTLSAETRVRTR